MKNLRYFTFERNRYFYGKLLSVDDFELEQRYMNDKRRLLNRFIYGTGVVCGMNVVPVDDMTITVEMGFALDFAGREIVIEQPVTKKLSLIDGFDSYTEEDEENSYLYLCVEYDETQKEPVHSIAGAKEQNNQRIEYNKYSEGYRFYLTNQEPESQHLSIKDLYQETKTIYWGNGIRITQTVPKYVQGNQEFDVTITVENLGQQKNVSFQYDLDLTCIQTDTSKCSISFSEEEFVKNSKYQFTKKLRTIAAENVKAKLSVLEESFCIEIGGIPIKASAKGTSTVKVISNNVKREILNQYHMSAMEEIVKDTYQQSIYLAKISMVRASDTYVIDEIEQMPFEQYLYNNHLMGALNEIALQEEDKKSVNDVRIEKKENNTQISKEKGQIKVATGVAIIDLGIGGSEGQKFFSPEIPHGLGLGRVNIILGEAYSLKEDSAIVYGATDIFEEKKAVVQADLAAKVYVDKGTFVIGLKCLAQTPERQVKIHWTAIKDGQEELKAKREKTLQIKPDMLNLLIRDNYYFEAIYDGNSESRILWSVKEADGGTIDKNGMYTAPNKAGVYEIVAQSMDEPERKASTFVVVRDIEG